MLEEQEVIERLLRSRRIAIVGLSDNPSRASYSIAMFLKSRGKVIYGVNPTLETWSGQPCYAALAEVPDSIDLVNVFRRPEYCPAIASAAMVAKAGGLWLQSGIISREARQIADAAGMDYVEDRCIMVEMASR